MSEDQRVESNLTGDQGASNTLNYASVMEGIKPIADPVISQPDLTRNLSSGNIWEQLRISSEATRTAAIPPYDTLPPDLGAIPSEGFRIPITRDRAPSPDITPVDQRRQNDINRDILNNSRTIHEQIKNGDHTDLALQVFRLFQGVSMNQNPISDARDRGEGLKLIETSIGTLNQLGRTLSVRSRDGQRVSLNLSAENKNLSITIGEGANATTMTIDHQRNIQMTGVQMSPADFLKRLQPRSGGRDRV